MLLLLLLVFLFPIAIYLLVLSSLNRRDRPTVVTGFWDTLGLFFAASGFLLAVGPALVFLFLFKTMSLAPENVGGDSLERFFEDWWLWWGTYFGILFGAAAILLCWRLRTTVIYNVETDLLEGILNETLNGLGFQADHRGRRWRLIHNPQPPDNPPSESGLSASLPSVVTQVPVSSHAELDLELFPAMCNATIHWVRVEPVRRRQIESTLTRQLEAARAFDNPAAAWMMGVSGILFGLVFLAVLIIFLNAYFPPKRW